MIHELWVHPSGTQTFCLAGPMGDGARALLERGSTLTWRCSADSHIEAMKRYCEYMGWGEYTTDFPEIDRRLAHGMHDGLVGDGSEPGGQVGILGGEPRGKGEDQQEERREQAHRDGDATHVSLPVNCHPCKNPLRP